MSEACNAVDEFHPADKTLNTKFGPRELERFLAKVRKTDGCWLWQSTTMKKGYGQFSLGGRSTQHTQLAHRISYRLFRGAIPAGLNVLHECDVPNCVNPSHLFLGTLAENNADMRRKGRGGRATGEKNGTRRHPEKLRRGEANNMCRSLTGDKVRAIRDDYKNQPVTHAVLARRYGASKAQIGKVILRKSWAHIP
jgi:hypothetical protein